MEADVLGWVVALGVGGILAELVRSTLQRKKMGAEAAKIITEAATGLLMPLQERIKELEAVVQATREELEEARRSLALAREELDRIRRNKGCSCGGAPLGG